MAQELNPAGIARPAANYAHAMLSVAPTRWVHTSGIVPTRPDGSVPEALADQADVIWTTIAALLQEGQLELGDVVSMTTYVVQGNDLGVVMEARDRALAGHRAASTLVVVPALARPEWRLEISAVACR